VLHGCDHSLDDTSAGRVNPTSFSIELDFNDNKDVFSGWHLFYHGSPIQAFPGRMIVCE